MAAAAVSAALAALSASTIGVIAVVAGVGVTLWYVWGPGEEWVNEHASELWEHIEAGTWAEYLKNEVNLEEMKRLITEWSQNIIDSMIEYFTPHFELGYSNYMISYDKANMGKSIQINDFHVWFADMLGKILRGSDPSLK